MEIAWQQRLLIAVAVLTAVVVGWEIAHGSAGLAGALGGLLALWLATRFSGVAPDVLVAGGVLVGYLVGNRGFAQLQVPGFPLLPGEAALGLGLLFVVVRGTRSKQLPLNRAFLDAVLLVWLALGAVRLRLDIPAHGFLALRDFALLYYALFFFLARAWGADAASRSWLERGLTVGFVACAPVFFAFTAWPEVFTRQLVIFGTPPIYVKGDVAGGFMAAGALWFLGRFRTTGQRRWLALVATNLIGVAFSNSRAALVAVVVAGVWLVICRDWRRLRPLAGLAAVGLLVLVAASLAGDRPWTRSPAYRLYESAASMVDFAGTGAYQSADLGDKPENNQFRLTWWRVVVDETLAKSPWFGLGFGYDLADQFARVYYPEGSDEFNARSPHNFPLTVFGRMGVLGFALLLAALAGLARQTWRAGRAAARGDDPGQAFSLLLGVWAIFASACFGVVLEGPMGATVFWTLWGLASAPAPVADEAPAPADLHPVASEPALAVRSTP